MALDKIYIFLDGDIEWYKPGDWETPPPNRVEYIRKDALLEWLEALKAHSLELRDAGYGDVFYGAQIAILEETIHKIESL